MKKEVKKITGKEIPQDKWFYLPNGKPVKSLKELRKALKSLSDTDYKHHVNKNKNDFANWVYDVVGNNKLAKDLEKAKTKKDMIRSIDAELEHVNDLKVIEQVMAGEKPKKQKKKQAKPKKASKPAKKKKKQAKPKKSAKPAMQEHAERIKTKTKESMKKIKEFLYNEQEDNRKVFINGIFQGIIIGVLATVLVIFIISRYVNVCK